MDHDHGEMSWRDDAVEAVLSARREALGSRSVERVGVEEVAGRVLSEDVIAEHDVPAYDKATMDGYAFDVTDDYPLELVETEIFPEDAPPSIEEGQAVEIATGSSLPPEANAVLKREEATVDGGTLTGSEIEPGTYTYERGSNVARGEQLFAAGERLAAKDAILLNDLGRDEVAVAERFSVGVLATGTEIHEGRQDDLDSPMLVNLIRSWGHDATYEGTVPDDYDRIEDAIAATADRHDVVVTTGGTSVGHKDYVVRALERRGDIHFHRVRVRPGKPIAMASLDDAVAFAIPGKPLGAYTISTLVMRPFFTGQTDLPTVEARLSVDVSIGPRGFEYVVPVTLEGDTAVPLGHVDSPLQVYDETFDPSVLSSSTRATRADGFVVTESPLSADEPAGVVPYPVVE
jgi:molybdopterin molybdotransferase